MRYIVTGPALRFRGANKKIMEIPHGDWVEFDEGDEVGIQGLLDIGAIKPVPELKVEEVERPKPKKKKDED